MLATDIAELYRHRWEEETAFNVLQMTLTCEDSGIGHPRAATFLFCMAILAFNLRQSLFAVLYATHAEEEVAEGAIPFCVFNWGVWVKVYLRIGGCYPSVCVALF